MPHKRHPLGGVFGAFMAYLSRQQTIPYRLEISDLVRSAQWRLEEFTRACETCVRAAQVADADTSLDPKVFYERGMANREVFDSLEMFLALWARLSLFFFPAAKSDFAKTRSATLQLLFDINNTSPLADRELRNSWMHYDERVDLGVEKGELPGGQRFTFAKDTTELARRRTLRLIEIDTCVVHFHDQAGNLISRKLPDLKPVLEELWRGVGEASKRLTLLPEDAT
jgi:hypothetical protein